MNQQAFTQWLKEQQSILEQVIHNAAQSFLKKHDPVENFGYDLRCSQKEAYNLMNGLDLCYDRYTTPLAYSLWYQARRINVFLTHFQNKIFEAGSASTPVEIFDLGAGTGCVQMCFGLGHVAFSRHGVKPLVRIINVDSSPFMLEYLRDFIWPEMIKFYPELQHLPVEYHVYSWSNRQELGITNPWICASYLFDSSDNKEYLESNFAELIKAFNPEKVLLLTSAQEEKKRMMNSIASSLNKVGYQMNLNRLSDDIYKGEINSVTILRNQLREKYNLQASKSAVSWKDGSFQGLVLEKKQAGLFYNLRSLPDEFDLFNPPLKVRREVELNELQEEAAKFEVKPTIITGPAGCGKSVVVTEKIINTLEHFQWTKPLRILITTFNKALIKQLRGWLIDMLKSRSKTFVDHHYKNPSDGTGFIKTGNNNCVKIEFVHFEMLPKLIGGIKNLPFNEQTHIEKLTEIITTVRRELDLKPQTLQEALTPGFLMEEYHRVIFGLQCPINKGVDVYQAIDRKGRGNRPRLERGEARKAVWLCLEKYARWMHLNPTAGHSFIARRQLFYNRLKAGVIEDKFDYVFVDEFQDCTPSDFDIMSMLLKDVDNLHIAGDLAQAVHIGKSGTIPRDTDMSKRKIHRLKGSYRLPLRICEALQPLSKFIAGETEEKGITEEITPYKGAPPGARPIFVFAEDERMLAAKLSKLKSRYSAFDLNLITVLETDQNLCKELKSLGEPVETSTILKLKGLEKSIVVWSLQAMLEFEKEIFEFAYTIMTRTNCLLIIAATNNHEPVYRQVLPFIRLDRLIFWDGQSETTWAALKSVNQEKVGETAEP